MGYHAETSMIENRNKWAHDMAYQLAMVASAYFDSDDEEFISNFTKDIKRVLISAENRGYQIAYKEWHQTRE